MPALPRKTIFLATVLAVAFSSSGCIKQYAVRSVADVLGESGDGYASDDDPELVEAAAPFGLKLMEQVLAKEPKHVGLLTSLDSGFTSYSVAFVTEDADELEEKDVARAQALRERARKLFLRARNYGLRGLEVNHPGFTAAFLDGGDATTRTRFLDGMKVSDVPLLYWTSAAWSLAITQAKNDMHLVGQLPLAEQMMRRALALDESWGRGAIHEYFVALDGGRSEAEGGGPAKAKEHLARSLTLNKNEKLGAIVSYAEIVCVGQQDKTEFTKLLQQVLAFDVNSAPSERLANLLAQRRARWLLGRTDDLFAN